MFGIQKLVKLLKNTTSNSALILDPLEFSVLINYNEFVSLVALQNVPTCCERNNCYEATPLGQASTVYKINMPHVEIQSIAGLPFPPATLFRVFGVT